MTMPPDALAALHARCFETPRPWRAHEFTSMLASYGVFLHSTQAGFILGREIVGEAEVLTLAVDPTSQRRGVGRMLLAEFEAQAIQRGATEAFLEVACDNVAAIALYRTANYTESGKRAAYYSPPNGPKIDALMMRKPLI